MADLKKQLAEVTSGSFDRVQKPPRVQKKKERLAKENKSKFNIEPQQHSFNLEEDTQSQRKVISQQQQQQSYNQQQQRNQFQQQQPQKFNNNQQQYYNQQQFNNNNNNPGQFQQQFSEPQSTQPRQLVQGETNDEDPVSQFRKLFLFIFQVVGRRNLMVCSTNLEKPWVRTLQWIRRPISTPHSLN